MIQGWLLCVNYKPHKPHKLLLPAIADPSVPRMIVTRRWKKLCLAEKHCHNKVSRLLSGDNTERISLKAA